MCTSSMCLTYIYNTQCDICQKMYTSPDVLRQHQRVHTGERPFTCTICGSKFKVSLPSLSLPLSPPPSLFTHISPLLPSADVCTFSCSPAHPQRYKEVRVFGVRQEVCSFASSGTSSHDPHGGEALYLRNMRSRLQPGKVKGGTRVCLCAGMCYVQ